MFKICLVTHFLFLLLLLNLGGLNVHLGFVVGCHEMEREALLKFKQSLMFNNHSLSSWEGRDCCNWEGVGCNKVTTYVNRLDLHSPSCYNFKESFTTSQLDLSLLELRHLNYLDLSCNDFQHSQIPRFIGSFKHLIHLNLSHNNLTSTLSDWLGDLRTLRVLDVSSNNIYGQIPTSMGNLSSIEELDLSDNSLNGTIPEGLGQCKSLVSVDFSSNFLKGVVSESHLANLSRLDYLDMSFNPLDLNLISDWSPPFQLTELHMTSCKIQSQFPKWVTDQTNLIMLDLSDNMIAGKIAQWFSSTELREINISHNQITGPIPYFSSSQLESIDLSYNLLSGPLLPDDSYAKNDTVGLSVCQLPGLKFLDLQRNNIKDTIIDCWSNSNNLSYINLSSNILSGNIPPTILQLPFLQILKMNNNSLQGPIPATLIDDDYYSHSKSSLLQFDLGENKLVGNIPNNWGKDTYPFLQILRLRGNQLVGTIPTTLCPLPKLQFIDLAHNNLTGGVPRCLGHLIGMMPQSSHSSHDGQNQDGQTNITPHIYGCTKDPKKVCEIFVDSPGYMASFDRLISNYTGRAEDITAVVLKGRDMQYTTTLTFVVNLDLSSNYLEGFIPEEITNLSTLIGLNLSHNHLTGNIPKNIGELSSLESLDLSNNNLFGTIPPSISALTSMVFLNLSYNNLHGQIPTGRQLQVLEGLSMAYIGNPGLCGDPLPNKCDSGHDETQPTQGNDKPDREGNWARPMLYFVIFSGFATGFWGIVGSMLLKRRFRFAVFQHVGNVSDYLYVQVMIRLNRLKNEVAES